MKKLLTAFLVGYATMSNAQNLSLIVNVKKIKNNDGMIYALLQDPTKKSLQQQWVKIDKNESQVIFKNLIPAKYAVRVYHDANNNKKLDTDFFGIPKESWGCSNDVRPHFAAPKFEDMIFTLEKDLTITVNMN
jgi:uncharacterized protein (DUF2141 family)